VLKFFERAYFINKGELANYEPTEENPRAKKE
jgi:hypothetical protein